MKDVSRWPPLAFFVSLAAASTNVICCGGASSDKSTAGTSASEGSVPGDSGASPGADGASTGPDTGTTPPPGGDAASEADAPGDGSTAPGVRWIGRAAPGGQAGVALGKFAWSASGFAATVSGPKISVSLQTEGSTSSAFFQPVLDGTPGTRFQVMAGAPQAVVLGTGLSPGPHTVEVYRDSEGMYGDTALLGFPDGTLGVPPQGKRRLIEIVGDSISAGYGNLGTETHPPWTNSCTFSLDTESAYQSYGAVLGRSLEAEVSIIARSGWGMYRDINGNTSNVVPTVYADALGTQASPAWSFAPQPDAVIVNLGTNDSTMGDPGQPFEDAYVAFLRTVRGRYASAWIFLTIGPMTADPPLSAMRVHLDDIVATLGDARVTTVEIAEQDTTSTGCDYHPNVAEDQVMATTLATAVRSKLSW